MMPSDMIDWLLLPIDLSRSHDIGVHAMWHARLMTLGWAVLFPVGITIARFFKITPRQNWPHRLDNKLWWYAHLTLQYVAAAAMIVALAVLWQMPGRRGMMHLHAVIGWTVIALCCTQFVGGWLRGSKGGPTDPAPDGSLSGDHFNMTRRRRIFEYVHKSLGYLAIFLGTAAIVNGLWLVNAPHWMWFTLAAWWMCLLGAWIVLQRRGFAVDTYQAIWGPEPSFPGNQIEPIGWGARRPDARSGQQREKK